MFCAMLGTIAGNLALTLGSTGGVYIAGGIAPKLGELFLTSEFRERFEAKGRFRDYLAPIPDLSRHPSNAGLPRPQIDAGEIGQGLTWLLQDR